MEHINEHERAIRKKIIEGANKPFLVEAYFLSIEGGNYDLASNLSKRLPAGHVAPTFAFASVHAYEAYSILEKDSLGKTEIEKAREAIARANFLYDLTRDGKPELRVEISKLSEMLDWSFQRAVPLEESEKEAA